MSFAGRRPREHGSHPLLASMGLSNILNELPVTALVVASDGTIVYRNKASEAQLRDLMARGASEGVRELRAAILEAARRGTTFPHVEIVSVDVDAEDFHAKILTSISALPGGYLVHWRDVTEERIRVGAMADAADELAHASQTFERLSGQLTSEATAVAERAETVSSGATQLSASIQSISTSASAAANDTQTAVGAADSASERISQLIDSSTQVETVSKLINSIAEQTNLLALNATIEAARAGEAGKGFAVVAGEVKELAGRTSEATDRIAKTIQAIQSDSATVAGAIGRIVDLIGEIESKQTMIAGAVEEQSATAAEMSATVSAVAGSAQSTAQVVVELREVAATVLSKSRQLHDLV